MKVLTETLQLLRRRACSAGFGVQSPTAYRFVTEVLRATVPADPFPYINDGGGPTRLARVCFRIAVARKPSVCINKTQSHMLRLYLHAANAGCHVNSEVGDMPADMIIADACALCSDEAGTEQLLANAPTEGCLVVDSINHNNACLRWWETIVADPRTIQTFDLYGIGVAFFDRGKSKQNYRLIF